MGKEMTGMDNANEDIAELESDSEEENAEFIYKAQK